MSTATLNVWVTEVGEPCKIDMEHQWFVHVLHCDGTALNWCDREYINILTKCGHVEIEVPPGQYMVVATWSPGQPKNPTQLGNHLTHLQIVRVNCGDHACVTLFPPTAHFCGWWFIRALRDAVALDALDRGVADEAYAAVERVLDALPANEFTEATKRLGEQRPG